MMIREADNRAEALIDKLVDVWEKSVKETHHFLDTEAIEEIKHYVPAAIESTFHLLIALNESDEPIAFLGTGNGMLDMLFIHPEERGKGLGRKMLEKAIAEYGCNELTVNEENPDAIAFYKHMGFHAYRRSDTDEDGRPYPIIYMKL